MCYVLVTILYKEKEGPLLKNVISETFILEGVNWRTRRDFERENEEGIYAGGRLAGFRTDGVTLITALFMSEEDHHMYHAFIIPFAHLDFWSQGTDPQSI